MPDITKRLHYFDHQFLRANDFNDEQGYHVNRLRIHNRALHTPGIAEGLRVIFETGATLVTVQKGTAVDAEGQLIVLTEDTRVELSDQPPDTPVYITIAYRETQTDISKESDVHDYTRWTEEPDIRDVTKRPDNPNMQLVLARVNRAGTTVSSVDEADRKAAGAASGDISTHMITLMRDGIDPNKWPRLSCTDVNQAALANGSLRIDDGREVLFADNGQIRSLDNNHRIVFNRANNRLEFYEMGDISFNTGGPQTEKLRILASGNVGVGAPAAGDRLEVGGTLRILTGSNPVRFTAGWSNFPAGAPNQAEISNDTGTYKTLMIVGNSSGGTGRRVSVWDRLEVNGSLAVTGPITPSAGDGAGNGIQFPANPGGGSGDEAYIRYLIRSGESATLRIGINNDPDDTLNFWQSGADRMVISGGNVGIGTPTPNQPLTIQGGAGTYMNVRTANGAQEILLGADATGGIVSTMTNHDLQLRAGGNSTKVWVKANSNVGVGIDNPQDRLDVAGGVRILTGSNPIRFTNAWSGFPDAANNQAEISNDTATYKTLMIIGNKSNDGTVRRVSVWDRFEVNGNMVATGTVYWGESAARTEYKDDAGLINSKSGFFQTANPANYYAGATGWQHLIEARHTNAANNYALQIAGSFFDQKLYVRKTNNESKTAWSQFVLVNSAGNVGIGTDDPGTSKLRLANNANDFVSYRFADNGSGQLEFAAWSAGWNINSLTAGKNLYLNRDVAANSNVLVGRAGQELFVRGSDGAVGIGSNTNPQDKLDVAGGLRILTGAGQNPIRFTSGWSNFSGGAGQANGQSEISNDTGTYKTLMLVGNKSNDGSTRRVSVWDRLEVNGSFAVTGPITPSVGDGGNNGIQFPSNPGGGAGDEAFIRYFVRAGESTTLRIGIANDPDDVISFWQSGAERMLMTAGQVLVNGNLLVGGGKGFYVMDQFVNNVGETLEQGDVIVIGRDQSSMFFGKDNNIPVAEVDLTETAYDTRVCGVVCEVHGTFIPAEEKPSGAAKSRGRKSKANAEAAEEPPAGPRVEAFKGSELAQMDHKKVEPGQTGFMITLGAFSHCKVDADIAPIEVGDLLTTSPTRGHAQKVEDPARASGAILGKALGSLRKGRGKIPIIVTL